MKKILIGGIVLVMALAIPVTLTLVSQQQDIRQQAQETTCNTNLQQYFNNLSTQPNTGTQSWQQYQNQWVGSNCPSPYLAPSIAVPSISPSVTNTGGNFQQGSYLCTYYQSYLAKLQSSGACTSSPTICNQISTQLKNLNCTGTNLSPTSKPAPSGSPTTAVPTFPPANPPIYDALVDLNDDGKIDELDLNILYAGFAKRKGD